MNSASQQTSARPAVRLFSVTVNPLTIENLNALITESVTSSQRCVIIGHHNLHSIYLCHHDSKMRDFYSQAQYLHIDGMALVLLGKLLGYPLQREHRVTYVDWVHPLMAEAERQGWRVFYLGSKPGVAARGAEILRGEFPRLQIETANGYFDASLGSPNNQEMLDKINTYRPNVLMVGMGMPRQENWILDNLDNIDANTILPCGACIDYVAGAIPTPPRWMGRFGLEWLFRLLSEPRRLWQRYLVEPWFILWLFATERFKRRHLTD